MSQSSLEEVWGVLKMVFLFLFTHIGFNDSGTSALLISKSKTMIRRRRVQTPARNKKSSSWDAVFQNRAQWRFWLTAAVSILASRLVAQTPRLAAIFTDNLVLQRDVPVPVWGWAAPDTTVSVEFAGQRVEAKAGLDGRWQAVMAPLPACAEGRVLIARAGGTTIECRNVVVGEVWVAAGQSNMANGGPNLDTGLYPFHISPEGPMPEFRLINYGWGASLDPLPDADPAGPPVRPWSVFTGIHRGENGNIPKFFARYLRDTLKVPVGVVEIAVPGTNQTAWMAKETLEQFPGSKEHANYYVESLATEEANLAKMGGTIKTWAQFKKAEEEWRRTKEGAWPGQALQWGLRVHNFPTACYNTRVHPLAPFAIRGVIWHQGESGPGGPYGERMVAMVRQWRKLFGQDFYFVWGTLARDTLSSPLVDPAATWFFATGHAHRQAMALFEGDSKVEWTELYDLGSHDVHFAQKAEAGRRMALAALHAAYGMPTIFSGPRLARLTIQGPRAIAQFDLVGNGIVYRPSFMGISGVIVEGKTGPTRWAQVKVIDARTIEIEHPDDVEISGVGYGNSPNPHETLFNSAGLPLSPFAQGLQKVFFDGQFDRVRLVTVEDGGKEPIHINIPHVRREGYIFNFAWLPKEAPAVRRVRALISNEWSGVEIRVGNQCAEPEISEVAGRRVATFNAPTNGTWIIVAEPGKAEMFEKINRF